MHESLARFRRTPQKVRLGALAIALVTLALATHGAIKSLAMVGNVFPGFLLYESQKLAGGSPGRYVVVAPFQFADWPETAGPFPDNRWLFAVEDVPVGSAAQVYTTLAASPPGTAVRYRLRWNQVEGEVVMPTRRFTLGDWLRVFSPSLLVPVVFMGAGLILWVMKPADPVNRAFLAFSGTVAIMLFPSLINYSPGPFSHLYFQLWVLGLYLLPATVLQLALLFPEPHRYARWRLAGYVPSIVLLLLYNAVFYWPSYWRPCPLGSSVQPYFLAGVGYEAVVGIFAFAILMNAYRSASLPLARQRIRVVALGTLVGFGPTIGSSLVAVLETGAEPNLQEALWLFFPASVAYAIVKHDLFEIDAAVKRSVYYLALTGVVGIMYVAAVTVFNMLLRAGALTESPAFAVLFALAVLVVFNPLRARLQSIVDRVFFHTRYDGAQLLAQAGEALATLRTRDEIVGLVRDTVETALPNGNTRLIEVVPSTLAAALSTGRVVTALDAPELCPDPGGHDAQSSAFTELGAQVAVPMRWQGALLGALTLAPKRSGRFYTAGDAEFLRALAHAAMLALRNAVSYEELAALNASLEDRVRARTAQLVQAEQMASLGRLVAGVAHEINNPVSFIAGSISPLRQRLKALATSVSSPALREVAEIEQLIDIMARGAERTATIVNDLRSFSRLGEAPRKAVDLHDGIEGSLRLLEPQWRERIAVHRCYGYLPLVDGDPGRLNQVFMNLLTNASDAITTTGNIWIGTHADDGEVSITIRDDGCGIPSDALGRIFDPFFTTKEIGKGTGLGLAIARNVISAHRGHIDVESTPGTGSTFRVTLPATTTHSDTKT